MRSFTSNRQHARWLAGLLAVGVITLVGIFARPLAHGAADVSEPMLLVTADLRGHALLAFDPARPGDVRRIALPGGPHELALLPDGRVVTSLEQVGMLALADLGSGAVETITVGGFPHGLAVSGGVLAFTDRERNQVRRLQLDDWTELEAIVSGRSPHAIAALADSSLVVANAGDDTVTLGGHTVAVSALPETVAVSPRSDRVATAGARGDWVEVLGLDSAVQARAEVGGRPVRVVFDPAGEQLAVALSATAAVALVDAHGLVRRIAVGGLPDGLAYDPAGQLLYVSDLTAGRLTVVDVARSRVWAVYTGVGMSTGALLFVPHGGTVGGLPSPLVRQ